MRYALLFIVALLALALPGLATAGNDGSPVLTQSIVITLDPPDPVFDDGGGGGVYPICRSTCYIPNAYGWCYEPLCGRVHFAICRWFGTYDGYVWSPIV
jgi:hypothetical protein